MVQGLLRLVFPRGLFEPLSFGLLEMRPFGLCLLLLGADCLLLARCLAGSFDLPKPSLCPFCPGHSLSFGSPALASSSLLVLSCLPVSPRPNLPASEPAHQRHPQQDPCQGRAPPGEGAPPPHTCLGPSPREPCLGSRASPRAVRAPQQAADTRGHLDVTPTSTALPDPLLLTSAFPLCLPFLSLLLLPALLPPFPHPSPHSFSIFLPSFLSFLDHFHLPNSSLFWLFLTHKHFSNTRFVSLGFI